MTHRHPRRESDSQPTPRKDRLVQTRVHRDLETRLKQEARRRRVSVSQFIRNVLEDTFNLVDGVIGSVDDIVTESREFASQLRRDATHGARDRGRTAVRREPQQESEGTRPPRDPQESEVTEAASSAALSHVQAWNPVILNRPARCSRCGRRMARGEHCYGGLCEVADRPAAWLCNHCIEEL